MTKRMSPEKLQTISQIAVVIGLILAGVGGFGAYYYREVVQDAKETAAVAREAALRAWGYFEAQEILSLSASLFIKTSAPVSRFIELLSDVHLRIHPGENRPLALGTVLDFPQLDGKPFRDEGRRNASGDRAVGWLWMLYEPEKGYWWKATSHVWADPTTPAAGVDAAIPWKRSSFGTLTSLRDLGSVPHFGVSLPWEMVEMGVEEISLQFRTHTNEVHLDFSTYGLEGLSWLQKQQAGQLPPASRLPLGISMSGQEALDLLRQQFVARRLGQEEPRPYRGIMGLTGPEGRSVRFFPTMPKGFDGREYSFTVTVPSKPQ